MAGVSPTWSEFPSARRSGRIRSWLFPRGPACDRRERSCSGGWISAEKARSLFPVQFAHSETVPGACTLSPIARGRVTPPERFLPPAEDLKPLPQTNFDQLSPSPDYLTSPHSSPR